MIYIYSLTNPETNKIFYVGKTKNLKERHYLHCINPKTNTGKALKVNGIKPIISILESIESHEHRDYKGKESGWILKMLADGHPLENIMYPKPDKYDPLTRTGGKWLLN